VDPGRLTEVWAELVNELVDIESFQAQTDHGKEVEVRVDSVTDLKARLLPDLLLDPPTDQGGIWITEEVPGHPQVPGLTDKVLRRWSAAYGLVDSRTSVATGHPDRIGEGVAYRLDGCLNQVLQALHDLVGGIELLLHPLIVTLCRLRSEELMQREVRREVAVTNHSSSH